MRMENEKKRSLARLLKTSDAIPVTGIVPAPENFFSEFRTSRFAMKIGPISKQIKGKQNHKTEKPTSFKTLMT